MPSAACIPVHSAPPSTLPVYTSSSVFSDRRCLCRLPCPLFPVCVNPIDSISASSTVFIDDSSSAPFGAGTGAEEEEEEELESWAEMRWSGAGNRFVINHSTAGKEHQPPVMSTGSSLSIHGRAKSSVQIYSNTTNNRSGVMNSDLILFPLDGAGGLSLSLLLSISLLNIIISGLQPSQLWSGWPEEQEEANNKKRRHLSIPCSLLFNHNRNRDDDYFITKISIWFDPPQILFCLSYIFI